MKPPEEVRREFVRQWLHKATEDMKAAKHLLGGDAELTLPTAFHAQQAAEKYLKAVLVWHQVDFPKTHDIGRLLELVGTVDAHLADLVAGAAALTPFGVEFRYPADLPEPTRKEARAAVAVANRVLQAVFKHLPREFGSGGGRG
jgi:HEPN domain-containing protein